MRVVVDAWNVLHVQGVLPPGLAGIGLAGLGRLMLATRWGRTHITLACDGPIQARPEGVPAAIHVAWSGTEEADDIIEGLIDRTTSPGRLVIVSSDNRLRKAAKRRRCKRLTSEQFLRTILDDLAAKPPDRPDSPEHRDRPDDQAADWERQFGLTSDELETMKAEADAEEFADVLPMTDPPEPPAPVQSQRAPRRRPPEATQPPMPFPASLIEQAMRIAQGT
ncbi:MAG: NYN domain-containing protein [Phycisphaerales bacterium]|nr:NYN domain-containing protein [Phycisphaerales bacterium]